MDYIVDSSCAALKDCVDFMKSRNFHNNEQSFSSDSTTLHRTHHATHFVATPRCSSTHLVVNCVFGALGQEGFQEDTVEHNNDTTVAKGDNFSTPMALLKDMVLDALDSIDSLVSTGVIPSSQVISDFASTGFSSSQIYFL